MATAASIFSVLLIPAQATTVTNCIEKDDKSECIGGTELKDDKAEVPNLDSEFKLDRTWRFRCRVQRGQV